MHSDRWLSGQKQQTVNLPTHAVYGGSNPPLSTRLPIVDGRLTIYEMRHATAISDRGSLRQFSWRARSAITHRQSTMTCGSNSMVESQPSKLLVAGSIPVSRSSPTFENRKSRGRSGEFRISSFDVLRALHTRPGRCSSVGRARPW